MEEQQHLHKSKEVSEKENEEKQALQGKVEKMERNSVKWEQIVDRLKS